MKFKRKNDFTLECIKYVLDHEREDFVEQVLRGKNHKNHVFYSAIRASYGRKGTAEILKSLRLERLAK